MQSGVDKKPIPDTVTTFLIGLGCNEGNLKLEERTGLYKAFGFHAKTCC